MQDEGARPVRVNLRPRTYRNDTLGGSGDGTSTTSALCVQVAVEETEPRGHVRNNRWVECLGQAGVRWRGGCFARFDAERAPDSRGLTRRLSKAIKMRRPRAKLKWKIFSGVFFERFFA